MIKQAIVSLFKGRINISDYWNRIAVILPVSIIFNISFVLLNSAIEKRLFSNTAAPILIIYLLLAAVFVTNIFLSILFLKIWARRLQDIGISGYWAILFSVVSLVFWIAEVLFTLAIGFISGQDNDSKYGPNTTKKPDNNINSGHKMLKIQTYLTINGRITKSDYQVVCLIFAIITSVKIFMSTLGDVRVNLLFDIMALIIATPVFVISIKRAHDIDISGWWALVPGVSFIVFFVQGSKGENKYGPDPLETQYSEPKNGTDNNPSELKLPLNEQDILQKPKELSFRLEYYAIGLNLLAALVIFIVIAIVFNNAQMQVNAGGLVIAGLLIATSIGLLKRRKYGLYFEYGIMCIAVLLSIIGIGVHTSFLIIIRQMFYIAICVSLIVYFNKRKDVFS